MFIEMWIMQRFHKKQQKKSWSKSDIDPDLSMTWRGKGKLKTKGNVVFPWEPVNLL